jgi:hypothetical protein
MLLHNNVSFHPITCSQLNSTEPTDTKVENPTLKLLEYKEFKRLHKDIYF